MSEKCYNCKDGVLREVKGRPYNYTESGLDNIVLHGVPQHVCKSCGETYVSIPNMEGLHLTIGKAICCKTNELLIPNEIKFLRKELHLKSKELAKALGVTPTTVSRWESSSGKFPIGEAEDRLLRGIYMMFVSDQLQGAVHLDALNLFSELQRKRKVPTKVKKLQFNPSDWLMGELNFCPAS
jgi:putative zinc finger/helix-turn-helix YgiT family protein